MPQSSFPPARATRCYRWYRGWAGLAEGLARRADAHPDRVSAGQARLRASNYMRTAEFFLAPHAPERRHAAAFARAQLDHGLRTLGIPSRRLQLPYEGAQMEAIYLPAERARALFVVHGETDPRVPVSEARQILGALVDRGVPVDSLIFADEGHGISKLSNRLIYYRRMVEFFDKHLK